MRATILMLVSGIMVANFGLVQPAGASSITPAEEEMMASDPTALAHVSDGGVEYSMYRDHKGAPCCDDGDCRPADDFVEVTDRGRAVVRLLVDGEWIDVPRSFVVAEDARDGRAHWCGGRLFTNSHRGWIAFPWCVILPPRES